MKEWIAFLLPPAVAFAGMRIGQWVLGDRFRERFGFGLRFAFGLALGMVVFSQSVLLTALLGVNASAALSWAALLWGVVELALLVPRTVVAAKQIRFQPGYGWFLLLLPLIYYGWVYARLSTLEGTLEYDANAFWVFKAKVFYLQQGRDLIHTLHQSNLGYAHLDYPLLVPCLYTFTYGAVGGVDEFVNKVWPFWMVVALCLALLSAARPWRRPHPLPILAAILFCFLPATMQFIREEGGTIPMAFGTGLSAILFVMAIAEADEMALAAGILSLAMCANTKFEGMVYTAFWGTLAIVYCWRRGWWRNRLPWKATAVAAICLLPYFCLRLEKPVLNVESSWLKEGIHSTGATAKLFPKTWTVNIGDRFFSKDFFHWESPDKQHLQFAGHWSGLASFNNPELSLLPWLLLVASALLLWKRPRSRLALGALLLVILGQLTFLSLAISCLPKMQADLSNVIEFAAGSVARYSYPFFVAAFLGIITLWNLAPETPVAAPIEPVPAASAKKSRRPSR